MATMNFNTTNATFRQLMGNGLSYHVPPFQRHYSWTEDEWDDLWQDIQGLFETDGEPAHYMGYLVLQSAKSKTTSFGKSNLEGDCGKPHSSGHSRKGCYRHLSPKNNRRGER